MLYPIGIQDFEGLRNDGFVYVDKTEIIYRLVKTGKYYFLSRPRRFGKSLLISTLEAYFLGKKHLFKGLAMEQLEQEWLPYPILRIDFNTEKYDSVETLESKLENSLSIWEEIYGRRESETSISLRFEGVIQRACERHQRRVVILVDEYDKPLLQAIDDEPLRENFTATLKAFYGALKSMDAYIKFALLTGVTKFSKVSVFSDLNNLNDISLDKQYYDICGISETELHAYFDEGIKALAEANNQTFEEACQRLRYEYDGYHFYLDAPGMYNPFSLLNTLKNKEYKDYWFQTGTPTFLVKLLQRKDYPLQDLQGISVPPSALDAKFDRNPIPVIYQSGYLTIAGRGERDFLKLDYPNNEVKLGFINFLMPYYNSKDEVEAPLAVWEFTKDLEAGRVEGFMTRLRSFFANAKFEQIGQDKEIWYENVIYLIMLLAGQYVEAERHTSNGIIDLLIKCRRFIYVMEFKVGRSAEEALAQINAKGYALPFASDPRRLYKIGVNFDNAIRNIQKWAVEEVNK